MTGSNNTLGVRITDVEAQFLCDVIGDKYAVYWSRLRQVDWRGKELSPAPRYHVVTFVSLEKRGLVTKDSALSYTFERRKVSACPLVATPRGHLAYAYWVAQLEEE